MKKRRLALLLISLSLAVALAGCVQPLASLDDDLGEPGAGPEPGPVVAQAYSQSGSYHYFFGTVTGLAINGTPQANVNGSFILAVKPPKAGSLALLASAGSLRILIDNARVTNATVGATTVTFTAQGRVYISRTSGTTTISGSLDLGARTGTITFALKGKAYTVTVGF